MNQIPLIKSLREVFFVKPSKRRPVWQLTLKSDPNKKRWNTKVPTFLPYGCKLMYDDKGELIPLDQKSKELWFECHRRHYESLEQNYNDFIWKKDSRNKFWKHTTIWKKEIALNKGEKLKLKSSKNKATPMGLLVENIDDEKPSEKAFEIWKQQVHNNRHLLEVLATCLNRGIAQSTIRRKKCVIKTLLEWQREVYPEKRFIEDMTFELAEEHKEWVMAGLAQNKLPYDITYALGILVELGSMFKIAKTRYNIRYKDLPGQEVARVPFAGSRGNRNPRSSRQPFTEEEALCIIDQLPTGSPLHFLSVICWYMGCRPQDAHIMRWDTFNLERRTIHLQPLKTIDPTSPTVLATPPIVDDWFYDYLVELKSDPNRDDTFLNWEVASTYLRTTDKEVAKNRSKPCPTRERYINSCNQSYGKDFSKALVKVKKPNSDEYFEPHLKRKGRRSLTFFQLNSFRRGRAFYWGIACGVTSFQLQKYLGHTNSSTTDIYLRENEKDGMNEDTFKNSLTAQKWRTFLGNSKAVAPTGVSILTTFTPEQIALMSPEQIGQLAQVLV